MAKKVSWKVAVAGVMKDGFSVSALGLPHVLQQTGIIVGSEIF